MRASGQLRRCKSRERGRDETPYARSDRQVKPSSRPSDGRQRQSNVGATERSNGLPSSQSDGRYASKALSSLADSPSTAPCPRQLSPVAVRLPDGVRGRAPVLASPSSSQRPL